MEGYRDKSTEGNVDFVCDRLYIKCMVQRCVEWLYFQIQKEVISDLTRENQFLSEEIWGLYVNL
jgi:hypothetical protein